MSLHGSAYQTCRLLSDEIKAKYSATVDALKSRFKPVDIEELRGAEFHQLIQKDQSVEALGLELQRLAKRACQRKLGAPKVDENFDELFNRACTTE
jgi:hypothetical protein